MFDVILAVLAATVQSAGGGVSTGSVTVAAMPETTLIAEPQLPSGQFTTAVEVKPILAMTRGNWISVREFNGEDLLYVTHLWAWRCGLVELKLGINGSVPEVWPLPECHLDQGAPNGITEADGLPYRSFDLGSIASVEVQITYDDLTTEQVMFNRMGQPQN
ncbi:MAG: hypothetical protein HRU33_02585 [Rhodobacteraceae bacterium]|nr:hypothetical protein [Paracoccaceae bacterium]